MGYFTLNSQENDGPTALREPYGLDARAEGTLASCGACGADSDACSVPRSAGTLREHPQCTPCPQVTGRTG